MKLWKITHDHCRVPPGATVHLLPYAIKPTEAEAAWQLQIDLAEDESICIEDTGYAVVSPYTELAAHTTAKPRPRSLIFVSGGVVTDVFSTERAMDVSIVDAQDVRAVSVTLQIVDDAIRTGIADFHRLL